MSIRIPIAAAGLVLIVVGSACNSKKQQKGPAAKKTEPAQVAHHVDEQTLNTLSLTAKAEQRLGIQLAQVRAEDRRQRRIWGGEIIVPPGQTIIVSAPITGTVSAPDKAPTPVPGSHVAAGQPVFAFTPLLSAEREVLTPAERVRVAQTKADVATAQIEAERQLESSKVAVEAAQIAYDRAQQLLKNKAGSQRNVDEADAALKLARQSQITAEARYRFLAGIKLDEQAGQVESRCLESPVSGILQSVDTAAGETVVAGKPLFRVIKVDRVWIRIPVYVGHWREIDTSQPAQVAEYGQDSSAEPRAATYVSAPPSADPLATTVDLFYELANEDGGLYPGQRLSVTLPMKTTGTCLVVPFRAVVYDILGGTWVYEKLEDHVYARRRVALRYVDGEQAILAAGLKPETFVVADGAAELFGAEFGVGH